MVKRWIGLSGKRLMWELILFFTLILGASILAVVLPTYKRVNRQFLTEITSSANNTVALAAANVDGFFSGYDNAIFPVTANYAYIVKAIKNERSSYADQDYLRNYLFSLFAVRKDLYGACMFIPEYNKCYVFIKNGDYVHTYMYYDDAIKQDDWYIKLTSSDTDTYVQPLLQTQPPSYRLMVRENFPIYHRSLPDTQGQGDVAVLSLYLNSSEFEDIANSMGVGRGRGCLLTDREHSVYYASDDWLEAKRALPDEDEFVLESPQGSYRCFRALAPQTNLEVVLCVPQREIDLPANSLSRFLFGIVPVLMIGAVFLIVTVSTRLTRPIERLAVHMKNFGEGSLEEKAEVTGHNEIAQLSRQFNQMVTDTNRLMDESVQLKLAEKNAVIKALEAETDPHYLYNTLQAIATLALEKNVPEVYRALLALSATYRFSLTGGSVVTLRRELEHVSNYVSIQKLRLQDRLCVQYTVDDLAYERGIPKLAVQMLVENAIKHSMLPQSKRLLVDVTAQVDERCLLLSVRDNGAGMSPERLAQVRRSLDDAAAQDGAIGLPNLCRRLKLLYGECARITIQTNSAGTNVTLRIPSLTRKEDERHESVAD